MRKNKNQENEEPLTEYMNAAENELIEVRVPQLPESVADATLSAWHKKPGEVVQRSENLVDLETDKVVLELPSPEGGVLSKILKGDGATVVSNEVIAVIEPRKTEAPAATPHEAEPAPVLRAAAEPEEERLTPAVRRLLAEHGLDPARITGTGRGGRITKEDVLRYIAERETTGAAATRTVPSPEPAPAPAAQPAVREPAVKEGRVERRVAMTRLRARIAERLLQAQQSTASLTTFNEVNMQAVMDLRRRHRERFEEKHGVKLGFMSFFIKASVEALRRFPVVNAFIDGQDIVYHDYCDIGIAVSAPRGLVVPILRDAQHLSFAEIELSIAEFSRKARDGSLSIEELMGGTFTISNGGIFGSLLSTPILNPPQSAILGMHKIEDRPVAEDGEIRIRPMMYIALSYDHRLIDGREAVLFLATIKECLEDPARLLLEI